MYISVKISRWASHFFFGVDIARIISYLRTGHVFEGSFANDEGTDGSKLAAGVGARGAQPKQRHNKALADK
jgi:hypothetical protein